MAEWISVKDRLPEDDENTDEWYGAITDGFRIRTVIVYDGISTYAANRVRKHLREPYEWDINDKEITHWMPLPEPPKEEEHG